MPTSIQLKCAGVIALSLLGTAVLASPPSNFTGEGLVAADLVQSTRVNSERIKFQTKDETDTAVVRLEFGADGSSGWHHHPGMVLVSVASGTVTVTNGNCESKSYGPGSPNGSVFVEGDTVHNVTSASGAVAYATAIVEEHDPPIFRIEDSAPSCATGPAIKSVRHHGH